MIGLIQGLFFFGVILALMYCRAPVKLWSMVIAGLLLLTTVFTAIHFYILIPIWAVFLLTAILFNVPSLRFNLLTRQLFAIVQSLLPTISDTEREALESGTVGWEGELFAGSPDWDALMRLPAPVLSKHEQAFLDNQVETLCAMLDEWKINHEDKDLPPKVWKYIKKEKFWAMVIPKAYGGLGFSHVAHSTVITKISTRSYSTAISIMVPNSLGPAELLQRYGTDEQKQYYLPRLASGKEVPCFALTGPEAGSDAGAMTDYGVVCQGKYKGKATLGIKLHFEKRYITLAPLTTLIGLAFKLYDPDQFLGKTKEIGITLALIPANTPGITTGKRHAPMNMGFMNGPLSGKKVFIPLEWIIGGPEKAGAGWRMLMESLSVGRGVSLPALSSGLAQVCYRMTGAYARIRRQFHAPIGRFEGIGEVMARIAGYTYLIEATRLFTLSVIEASGRPAVATAISKFQLTELARHVVNDAMDVHGGRGVQAGPKNYLADYYCASPISITVEGANILTRNLIIFGQGAMRCHPYVLKEVHAVEDADPDRGLIIFDSILYHHIGFFLSNTARCLVYALTGGRFIFTPKDKFLRYYLQQLTRMSTALAMVSDMTMLVLGGKLKRRERLSARLGDVLSNLYLASAVVKYYSDQGRPESDLPLVEFCLRHCLCEIQTSFMAFFANFPWRWLGIMLRFIIFPYGRPYTAASDRIEQHMAAQMLRPSKLRDRLTRYFYRSDKADDVTGGMDLALEKMMAVKTPLRQFRQALRKGQIKKNLPFEQQLDMAVDNRFITAEEAQAIKEYEQLRLFGIHVDEFNPQYFTRKERRYGTTKS